LGAREASLRPPFVSRVRKTIQRYALIAPGDRVLCAVSGGADSLALLDALLLLRAELGFEVAAAHVDHGLRPESGADAERVKAFCRRREIPLYAREVRVPRRGSLEAAAREVRHAALREMAGAAGAGKIALGHTATDRAETVLLFLARGAGRRGLGSMTPSADGGVIRPLCEVTRAEARSYALSRGLPFEDDPMNEDPAWTRSRVRRDLLPELRRLNPALDRSLAALAQDFAEEEAWMSEAARDEAERLFREAGEVHVAEAAALAGLPRPLRVRVLRRIAAAVRGSEARLGRRHLGALESLLLPGAREVHLPGAVGWRDGRWICLAPKRPAGAQAPEAVVVPGPGAVQAGDGIHFEFRLLHGPGEEEIAAEVARFDARRVGFPLCVRGARPGDWMRLSRGRRKVSDELSEARVPPSLRAAWPMVCDGEEVLWIPGIRQSARGSAAAGTEEVLRVEAHGLMFRDPYANQLGGRGSFRARKGGS
jgi:tRNA(Ile)-lysidine synthase